jgi:hypothetical protein
MLVDSKQLWLLASIFLFVGVFSSPILNFEYHRYDDLSQYLHDVASAYPNMTSLYSIGETLRSKYRQHVFSVKRQSVFTMGSTLCTHDQIITSSTEKIQNIRFKKLFSLETFFMRTMTANKKETIIGRSTH